MVADTQEHTHLLFVVTVYAWVYDYEKLKLNAQDIQTCGKQIDGCVYVTYPVLYVFI